MEETNVQAENSNQAEEVVLETTATEEVETVDWEAKAKKAEELANNYKIRAEKAEKVVKTSKPEVQPTLSTKDAMALLEAKIHEDDIDEVENWAKYKKITVSQALKSDELKAILDVRDEKRGTARATNVGTARHSPSKMTDEALLDRAKNRREIPESDEDMGRLVKAVIDARRSHK